MSKIVLTDVSSGFQLSKINENFQKIEDELNNKVLYRDAPTGEPNALEKDLDINGKSLYNVGDISLLGHDGFEEILAETEDARDAAISAATDAQNEAISAAASAIASGASAGESSGFASDAEISALSAAASAITAAAEVGALAVSSGAALVGFTQSGTGAVAQTVDSKLKQFVSVMDFGAVGDGVADDSAAIDAWITEIKSSGRKGYAPAGRYKCTTALTIDVAGCSGLGLTIEGAGMQRTIFDLTAVSSGVPFQVADGNGSTGGDAFYLSLSNFGVHTNINGVGAAIGKVDLSDAINGSVFDRLYFANANAGAGSCALEVNGVYQCSLNVTTNCSGSSANGDALRVRKMQFSTLTGSGGNAANSLHMTGGYSFGNTILNWDAEEVQKCVLIDVSNANTNTFIGGQFVWTVGGIDATAGSNNIFINPNFGVGSNKVLNTTGIAIIGDGKAYGTFVTPNTIVRSPDGASTHMIDAVAGQAASETYARANVRRWMLRMDNSSESGSDAGSNIILTRFSDAGSNLGDVWYVTRSNGRMTISELSALKVGFFGTAPLSAKPTVTGSRASGAALTSLIGALSSIGLINDTTTA